MEKQHRAALLTVAMVLVLATACRCFAQDALAPSVKQLRTPPAGAPVYDDSQPATDQYMALFRKDVRSVKKQIVAANMDFTDTEAEKFWPVYDRYAHDLAKIYDTKIALVEDYLQNYATMDGEQAESYIRRRATVEQDVMDLRLKYVPEFRKVLTGRQAALFFQIDWRLDLMINLQLSQVPLIDP
jgi:Spy/CpxP family protein refolding chaperone